MQEKLLALIQAVGDPTQQEEAGKCIIAIRQESPADFVGAVLSILQMPQAPDQVKAYAIIFCWQMFPEELSDLSNDAPHPFDVIGEEKVNQILEISLSLLSSGNKAFGHLAATLFGRVAALQLHRFPTLPFVASLIGILQKGPSEDVAVAVGIALEKLCQSALPEEEEVEQVVNAVFGVLGSCTSARIAAQMLGVLQMILAEKEDLMENAGFLEGLFTNLLKLSTVPETIEGVLKCWNVIGDANLMLLLTVLEQLLPFVISVVKEGEGNGVLCQACLLLRKLLEIPTLAEQVSGHFNTVASPLYQQMTEALLKVICSVESGDCDMSEAWEPHIAAFGALKQLAIVLPDEALVPLAATAATMLGSPEFGTRYGGLALMDAVVAFAESSMVIVQYFKPILEKVEDPAPRVRHMAVKCLKEGVLKGTSFNPTDEIKSQLLPMAEAIFPIQAHLTDVPRVARAVAKLLAALVEVDGFQHTETVLKALIDQAMAMGTHNFSSPFTAVESVVDKGQAQIVLKSFPVFVQILQKCVESESTLWMIRELQETFQAYLIRFGPELGDIVMTLAELLIRIAQLNNQYSPEVLVTLGILVQRVPAAASQLVPTVVERCLTALTQWGDYGSVYAASMCLTFVAHAGDMGETILQIMEALVKLIEDQDMPADTRRAVIDAIAALASSNPTVYSRVVTNVMGKIATFCMLLNYVWQDDEAEGQLMATGLGNCILQSLKVSPGEPGLHYVSMAKNWLVTVVDTEDIMERLVAVALNIVEHITTNYKNAMLEIIAECEDVGDFIVAQRELPEHKEQCQKILTGLGYQE